MLLIRMAWRNVWRQKRRTWLTVLAMAAGLVFCLTMTALMDGLYRDLFDQVVTEQIGHAQLHHPQFPKTRALWETIADGQGTLEQLEALEDVERGAVRVFGHALVGLGDRAVGVRLVGIQPDHEHALTGLSERVVSGRYLTDTPRREILLGDGLASRLEATLDDEVVALTQAADGSIGSELYTVVGTFNTGSDALDRRAAYLHASDLQDLLVLPGQVHEIAVIAPSREQISKAKKTSRRALRDRDVVVRSWDEIEPQMAAMLETGDAVGRLLLAFVFAIAALGILNTMLMAVFERTWELGLLQAIGMEPWQALALVALEAVVLAGLGIAIGVPLGLAGDAWLVFVGLDISPWIGDYSVAGTRFRGVLHGEFHVQRVVDAVLGLTVVALVAAIWPAVRAARLRPVDAMRRD